MKYKSKLGMPYMGSKRKLARPIVSEIIKRHGKIDTFYDLFGGGGAISFEAMQRHEIKEVHYNELNTGVVTLLEHVMSKGVTPELYRWIDRETFTKNKTKDTLLGGLCKVIWSFGNGQTSYLFSREIENSKRLLHEFVVNNNTDALAEFNKKNGTKITTGDNTSLFGDTTLNGRRMRVARAIKDRAGELQRLQQLERLQRLQQLERLQQLQQLQQLQRLERLQQLQRLEIHNGSYDEVKIKDNSIIYLDPPYKNTKKYQKGISHENLHEWIISQKNPVYVSSYEWEGLKLVAEYEHRSTLSGTANNKVTERLYYWGGNAN